MFFFFKYFSCPNMFGNDTRFIEKYSISKKNSPAAAYPSGRERHVANMFVLCGHCNRRLQRL